MINLNLNNKEIEMVLIALSKLDTTDMRETVPYLSFFIINEIGLNEKELDLMLMALSKLDCTKYKYEAKELYLNIVEQVNDLKFKEALRKNNKKEICNLKG
jgi:hypothetical protein